MFHKFHVLVTRHLASKTESIAKKLAMAPRGELSQIGRHLEGLTRMSHDTAGLFRELSSTFSGFAESRRQEIVTAPVSIGANFNNRYAEEARRRNRTPSETDMEIAHAESQLSSPTSFQ